MVADDEQLTESLAQKRAQVEELTAAHSNVKDKHTALQTALTNSEELLQTLLTGLTSKGTSNSGGGYMGQLADAKARLAQACTEEEQSKQKLSMSQKELKTLEARWKEVEREAGEGQKRLRAMQTEIDSFRKKVAECGWSEQKEREGDRAIRDVKAQIERLLGVRGFLNDLVSFLTCREQDLNKVRREVGNCDFQYEIASGNFDHSKVKGTVAKLITLKEEHFNKCTALEITAGNRLYNVVVETEQVGKDLLQHGRLKKRITIIPLNKIDRSTIPAHVRSQVISLTIY